MINLLPQDIKETNSFGAKNRVLLRWVAAFFVGILGIVLVVLFGYFQLNRSIAATQTQVRQSEQRLQEQNIQQTQQETEEIDSSIKLALQVLEKKILFSKMLERIGAVMPEGTILEGITLQEIEGGINLVANAQTYQTATQVQVNISDETSDVFKTADILSIDCTGTQYPQYPCKLTLRALFNEDNPFLFINQANAEDQNE